MKKCNYCKKNLKDTDTHCKFCGMAYTNVSARKKSKFLSYIFMVMIVSFVVSFIFASTLLSDTILVQNEGDLLTLGTFKDISFDKDIGLYTLSDYDVFVDTVSGGKEYVEGIDLFKTDLLNGIDEVEVLHQFQAIITMANNIYFKNEFTLIHDEYEFDIIVYHDLYDELNEVVLTYDHGYMEEFEDNTMILNDLEIIEGIVQSVLFEEYASEVIIEGYYELSNAYEDLGYCIGNYGIQYYDTQDSVQTKLSLTSNQSNLVMKISITGTLQNKYLYK